MGRLDLMEMPVEPRVRAKDAPFCGCCCRHHYRHIDCSVNDRIVAEQKRAWWEKNNEFWKEFYA